MQPRKEALLALLRGEKADFMPEVYFTMNDVEECLELYGDKITIMGGINNQMLDDENTTEEEIRAEVRRAYDTYVGKGRYIPYYIPIKEKNWIAYMDEANKYGAIIFNKQNFRESQLFVKMAEIFLKNTLDNAFQKMLK